MENTLSKQQIKALAAKARQDDAKKRAAKIKAEKAIQQEIADEELSPAASRQAVVDIRGPRTIRSGATFSLASPIRTMWRGGKSPNVLERHVEASEQLLRSWHTAASGIGSGSSDYASKGSSTGFGSGISEAKHRALLAQIKERDRLEAAVNYLGSLIDIVSHVLFDGSTIETFAKAHNQNAMLCMGRLLAALDMLADFYNPAPVRVKPVGIRAASFR